MVEFAGRASCLFEGQQRVTNRGPEVMMKVIANYFCLWPGSQGSGPFIFEIESRPAPSWEETAMTKRTGFLQIEEIPLNKVGLAIRAYGKKKNYLGRVEINHAGLAAFTGPRGKKCIANLSWEKLFAQLSTRKPRNGR